MPKQRRHHGDDLRGASRLAVEATRGVTALIEEMHATIASGPAILGKPLAVPAKLATGIVYGTIRGVAQIVGAGIDLALAQLAPLLGASAPGTDREIVLGVLNGVLGDYLVEHDNPLAITMQLRDHGDSIDPRVALPRATSKLAILVHGLCGTDHDFVRYGPDLGAAVERDLGYTAIYPHFNSGLHVSTNGRQLATLVDELVTAWPVALDEIVLIGHSMGGLVARSAVHIAELEQMSWRKKLRTLITLGAPHHGAPLERGGSWLDLLLAVSRYSAPLRRLGRIRSSGITDLRYGNVADHDWHGRDRFDHGSDPRQLVPLSADVACYAVAGTLSPQPGGKLRNDGIIPVDSALGLHDKPELVLAFPDTNRMIAYGVGHTDLLGSAPVYAAIRGWLTR